MFSLRADLIRNLGNMTNSKLHERRPIVPGPIRAYIDEVTECLHTITAYEGPALPPEDKLSFLRETRSPLPPHVIASSTSRWAHLTGFAFTCNPSNIPPFTPSCIHLALRRLALAQHTQRNDWE